MKKLSIILLLVLAGCTAIPDRLGYVGKDKALQEIKVLKSDYAISLDNKEKEIRDILGKIIDAKNLQLQKASNSNYGAIMGFNYYKEPSRLDIIIHNRVIEVSAALGVGPTIEAVKEENERMKVELDEKATTLEQLKKVSDIKTKENEDLVARTKVIELDKMRIENEKQKIKDEFAFKLSYKQDELNAANEIIIAKTKESAESKKYIEGNKTRISMITGSISIICLLGAIFSPVFKDKFGILSVLFGVISVGIIFVEPIHVAIFFAVVFIIGGIWAARKFHTVDKTATNLVGFIQDVKDNKPELFKAELKDGLDDFNSIYKRVNGKIEKIKDNSVISFIDEKLMGHQKK